MRSGSGGSKGKSMARLRVLPAFSSTVVFAVVTAAVCLTAVAAAGAATLKCERFDASCEGGDNCAGVEVCERGHNACFAVWKVSGKLNHKSGQSVSKMGCFTFHNEEDCRLGCTSEVVRPRQIHLCCCFGSMCNSNFSYVPAVPAAAEPSEDLSQNASTDAVGNIILHKKYPGYLVYVIVIVVVFVLAVIVCVGMYVYRQRKAARLSNSPLPAFDEDNDNNGKVSAATTVPSPTSCQQIELLEIKARGRFGAVWKGRRAGGGEIVAVKIFPLQDRCSWQAEQEIYNLPRMDHDNILKFIGVEKCGENLAMEFWLTTEFHDVGSLCDFLKSNVLSWADVCKIAFSVCRGLNHMHEEIPKGGGRDMKPAIAHRDFKSKNVLIKSDMTACIADFGLALVFEPGKACGDTHGQVGTRRYMAPEVLEGAINFSRDAFLRIDMYACGLVLWELASRHNNDTVAEYKLPFEAEVTSPTLEQMREFVVNRKRRPHINNEWRRTPSTLALCDTIEECWDHDAEARLSASCVMERIRSLQRLNNDRAAAAVAVEQMNAMNADETASVEMIPLIISDHCSS